jgi:antitoxin CcdA
MNILVAHPQGLNVSTPSIARGARTGKRAINLTLSADTLATAKALNLNVSQLCDAHLREVVRQEQESRWRAENAEFIAAYNTTVDAEGLPLDAWRTF